MSNRVIAMLSAFTLHPIPSVDGANDCLAAPINMHVFDRDLLLALATMAIERFQECGEGSGQLIRLI